MRDYYFWFFRVSCEEIFTTEAQRGEAATKNRNISRKGAKAAKKLNFRTWRSWRLGGSNSLFSCTFRRVLSTSAMQSLISGSQESLKTPIFLVCLVLGVIFGPSIGMGKPQSTLAA